MPPRHLRESTDLQESGDVPHVRRPDLAHQRLVASNAEIPPQQLSGPLCLRPRATDLPDLSAAHLSDAAAIGNFGHHDLQLHDAFCSAWPMGCPPEQRPTRIDDELFSARSELRSLPISAIAENRVFNDGSPSDTETDSRTKPDSGPRAESISS